MTGSGRSAYLFLSLLQARVGSSLISRLGELPPEGILKVSSRDIAGQMKMTDRAARSFDSLKSDFDPDALLQRLSERGIETLTPADEDYPGRLTEMPDPPPALFVDGDIPRGPTVAVVGSRKASPTGLGVARNLGRMLAERGVCVVSGLALGVDAAAHQGALDAGGPTVGVLGCGIDVVYPRSNRRLFGGVRESGAIISEYYLGEAPLAWRFPARNRIIAGLGDVLVVVEAAEKSGALITARHALDSGRDVWAVPGPPGVAECRGSNKLLADGAGVLWDLAEFVDALSPAPVRSGYSQEGLGFETSIPEELPANEAQALAGVGFEATPVDLAAEHSGLPMRELLSALTLLELKGYVSRDAAGAFLRRSAG
ncbi:MAG: DNA-processing protein DprA [Rubrobacteraceae bacterium]